MSFFLEPINLTLSPSDKWNTRLYKSTVNWAESFLSRGRKIYCVNVSKESFKTTFHWTLNSQKTFRERSFISKVFLIALYVSGIFPILAFGLKLYQRAQLNTEVWLAKGITLKQEIDSFKLEKTTILAKSEEPKEAVFYSSHQLVKEMLINAAKWCCDLKNNPYESQGVWKNATIDSAWKYAAFLLLEKGKLITEGTCKPYMKWGFVFSEDIFPLLSADLPDIKRHIDSLSSKDREQIRDLLTYEFQENKQLPFNIPTGSIAKFTLIKSHIEILALKLQKLYPDFRLKCDEIQFIPIEKYKEKFPEIFGKLEDVFSVVKTHLLAIQGENEPLFSLNNLKDKSKLFLKFSYLIILRMLSTSIIEDHSKTLIIAPKVSLDFKITRNAFKSNGLTSRSLEENNVIIDEAYQLTLWLKNNSSLSANWIEAIKNDSLPPTQIPKNQITYLTKLQLFLATRYLSPLLIEKMDSFELTSTDKSEIYYQYYTPFFEVIQNQSEPSDCVLKAILQEQNVTAEGQIVQTPFGLRELVVAYILKHPDEFRPFIDSSDQTLEIRCNQFLKEIQGVNPDDFFTSNIEFAALSRIFERPIFVFRDVEGRFKRDHSTGIPVPHFIYGSLQNKDKKPIYLYFDGNHSQLMKLKPINSFELFIFKTQVFWKLFRAKTL